VGTAAPAASAPAAAAAPTAAVSAAPQRFRWAGQAAATDAGVFVGMERGYFTEQGVAVEYVNFTSASEMIPSLATRQVEAAGMAVNAATINAVARGIEIKAVADKGLEGNTKDGTLTLFNAANTAVATWNLTQAVITGLTVNTIGVEHGSHLDVQATFDCSKIERTK